METTIPLTNNQEVDTKVTLKVIKTDADYEEAIYKLKSLMTKELNSEELNQLEVLSALIERFEQDNYKIDMPDPISAIKFFMDQRGLKQKDMIRYFGSASKVSEVLSGRRPLSLNMIRSLHKNLKIPAEILLQDMNKTRPPETDIDWSRFPLSEINKRGWFKGKIDNLYQLKEYAEDILKPFIDLLHTGCSSPLLPRSSVERFRSAKKIDTYALTIWQAGVVQKAIKSQIGDFSPKVLNGDFMRQICRLSVFEKGPLLAKELLNNNGIHLIIEEHFKHTYLDGAALMLTMGTPVIGLTLRYNRLDNFWFSLIHELSHIKLHLMSDKSPMFDDFDTPNEELSQIELEADNLARDTLIPPEHWNSAKSEVMGRNVRKESIKYHAKESGVHESIVAGRIRYEKQNYKILSSLVGIGIPRKLFEL